MHKYYIWNFLKKDWLQALQYMASYVCKILPRFHYVEIVVWDNVKKV